MGKNDFDQDFDFEKEFGFDPKSFLGTEEYDDDIDLSAFTDEELGLSPEAAPKADPSPAEDDLDLDGLDLDGDFDLDEELDLDDILNLGSEEEASDAEAPSDGFDLDFSEGEGLTDDLDFSEEDTFEDEPDFPGDTEPEETDMRSNMDYSEESGRNGQMGFEDIPLDEDGPAAAASAADRPRRTPPRRERKAPKTPKVPKVAVPNIFTKFIDLYFAPILNKSVLEEPVDPNNPRRRRRKSRSQIFKEVYLPPIIACVCLILVFSFVIGAISNAIDQKQAADESKQQEIQASQEAASLAELEYQRIMDEAAELAACYDYEGAVKKLDSFSGDMTQYQDMVAKRSEYVSIQDQLVKHEDPTLIPNLSFHVLIADLTRAMADDDDNAGNYNRNFVSVDEFTKILQQLYDNGYVLVDFDSFTEITTGASGNEQILPEPIYLPAGKKPVMLTETLVNYFDYMIDSNDDGKADAGGDGFASKLVIQNGEIKAEYVDASGNTLVGNYDLVPILEDFIKLHPDFSYRGARATLAVCGYQGIFGYRINTSYIASESQSYYDEQVAGAKEVVAKLREKGYTLACYTYDNVAYAPMTAAQIKDDLTSWTQQITPVIGEVNTFVFARTSGLTDYGGNAFNVMHTSGFRYFVSNADSPYAEVNNTYVRQNRLMVTGETMQWNSDRFTGMFDCAAILDVNTRGSVPH